MEKFTPVDWFVLIVTIVTIIVLMMIAFVVVTMGRPFDADLEVIGRTAVIVLCCAGAWMLLLRD